MFVANLMLGVLLHALLALDRAVDGRQHAEELHYEIHMSPVHARHREYRTNAATHHTSSLNYEELLQMF